MSISSYNSTTGELTTYAGSPNVDQVLSASSKNPIANKAVYNALAEKIEKTVNDLVNYYTTSQVYNKAEVRELIGAINTLTLEVVAALPTTGISDTTIYLVGPTSGNYDEYIHVGNAWVKIGDTQIDLSNYVTSEALTTALQSYYTKTAVDALLDSYYTKNEVQAELNNYYDKTEIDSALAGKQATLTFDNTPTAESNNPVTSQGIKAAIDTKANQTEVNDIVNIYGSKNLLNTSIITFPNGLSVTLNKDKSVTINGTNTSAGELRLFSSTGSELQYLNGCILSGITTGSNSTYFLRVVERNTPWTHYVRVYTEEQVISGIPNDDRIIDVGLYIYNNQTFNSFTFYPMIRLASITDDTYQPYAMTNQQLNSTRTLTPLISGIVENPNNIFAQQWGKTVSININGIKFTSLDTGGTTFMQSVPPSTNNSDVCYGFLMNNTSNKHALIQLINPSNTNTGILKVYGAETNVVYYGNITYISRNT